MCPYSHPCSSISLVLTPLLLTLTAPVLLLILLVTVLYTAITYLHNYLFNVFFPQSTASLTPPTTLWMRMLSVPNICSPLL